MSLTRPLRDEEDAFGRLLLDHLAGAAGTPVLEGADGWARPALPSDPFFAPYAAWPPAERQVFDAARGRVLDVGCGAGRHSLEAQRRGLEVVAIDVSPGAAEASRRRGVRDVRLLPLAQVGAALGPFGTVLMLCGNFGLVGTWAEAVRTLATLHAATAPDARIVLDSDIPDGDAEQVTIRIRYGRRVTPWFDLLLVSTGALAELAAAAGWHVATVVAGDEDDYFAVLEKHTA